MRRLMLTLMLAAACSGNNGPDGADDITPPVAAGQPEIPFPPELFLKGIEGEVMLYVVVDSTGIVVRDSTHIARSSGHVEFDAAAMAAAPALRFTPASRNGVPVAQAIQVPIRFAIPDSARTSEDTTR